MQILRVYLMLVWLFLSIGSFVLMVIESDANDRKGYLWLFITVALPTLIYVTRTHV
jgi:hypothetical protein